MLFDQLVESIIKPLKVWPIQIPPEDVEECKELCLNGHMGKEEWVHSRPDGSEVTLSAKDAIEEWDDNTARHECVHELQQRNIPDIFKDLPSLTHSDLSSDEYKDLNYHNRPPEIMAYAYDAARGADKADGHDNTKIYKRIGGEVEKLFNHYVKEYGKALGRTK